MNIQRFLKRNWRIFLVLGLATFLRFYRLEENLIFTGELGHNYLAIKNFIEEKSIPLTGPPTSHPWLSFGPLFYWIFAPFLVLGGYQPIVGAYFFAVAGVLAVLLNYLAINRLFGERAALISSALISISPLWLISTRAARFYSLVPLLFYPFWYFLVISLKNSKYLFWAALFFGIMLNFHLTPIVFLPAIFILLFIYRKNIKRVDILKSITGFLIPSLPLILSDSLQGFQMLKNFALWIPYRIAGFLKIIPQNSPTSEVISLNISSLVEFITTSFTWAQGVLGASLLGLALYSLYFLVNDKKSRSYKAWVVLGLLFITGYFGIFIHGQPPIHYFLPLYSIPILLIAGMIDRLTINNLRASIIIIGIIALGSVNSIYAFSDKWFFTGERVLPEVSFDLQNKVTDAIINDAMGKEFSLARVGQHDHFEGNFAQNYQYLLWLKGNEPIEGLSRMYTIYEETTKLPEESDELFWVGPIAVTKDE